MENNLEYTVITSENPTKVYEDFLIDLPTIDRYERKTKKKDTEKLAEGETEKIMTPDTDLFSVLFYHYYYLKRDHSLKSHLQVKSEFRGDYQKISLFLKEVVGLYFIFKKNKNDSSYDEVYQEIKDGLFEKDENGALILREANNIGQVFDDIYYFIDLKYAELLKKYINNPLIGKTKRLLFQELQDFDSPNHDNFIFSNFLDRELIDTEFYATHKRFKNKSYFRNFLLTSEDFTNPSLDAKTEVYKNLRRFYPLFKQQQAFKLDILKKANSFGFTSTQKNYIQKKFFFNENEIIESCFVPVANGKREKIEFSDKIFELFLSYMDGQLKGKNTIEPIDFKSYTDTYSLLKKTFEKHVGASDVFNKTFPSIPIISSSDLDQGMKQVEQLLKEIPSTKQGLKENLYFYENVSCNIALFLNDIIPKLKHDLQLFSNQELMQIESTISFVEGLKVDNEKIIHEIESIQSEVKKVIDTTINTLTKTATYMSKNFSANFDKDNILIKGDSKEITTSISQNSYYKSDNSIHNFFKQIIDTLANEKHQIHFNGNELELICTFKDVKVLLTLKESSGENPQIVLQYGNKINAENSETKKYTSYVPSGKLSIGVEENGSIAYAVDEIHPEIKGIKSIFKNIIGIDHQNPDGTPEKGSFLDKILSDGTNKNIPSDIYNSFLLNGLTYGYYGMNKSQHISDKVKNSRNGNKNTLDVSNSVVQSILTNFTFSEIPRQYTDVIKIDTHQHNNDTPYYYFHDDEESLKMCWGMKQWALDTEKDFDKIAIMKLKRGYYLDGHDFFSNEIKQVKKSLANRNSVFDPRDLSKLREINNLRYTRSGQFDFDIGDLLFGIFIDGPKKQKNTINHQFAQHFFTIENVKKLNSDDIQKAYNELLLMIVDNYELFTENDIQFKNLKVKELVSFIYELSQYTQSLKNENHKDSVIFLMGKCIESIVLKHISSVSLQQKIIYDTHALNKEDLDQITKSYSKATLKLLYTLSIEYANEIKAMSNKNFKKLIKHIGTKETETVPLSKELFVWNHLESELGSVHEMINKKDKIVKIETLVEVINKDVPSQKDIEFFVEHIGSKLTFARLSIELSNLYSTNINKIGSFIKKNNLLDHKKYPEVVNFVVEIISASKTIEPVSLELSQLEDMGNLFIDQRNVQNMRLDLLPSLYYFLLNLGITYHVLDDKVKAKETTLVSLKNYDPIQYTTGKESESIDYIFSKVGFLKRDILQMIEVSQNV